MSVRPIIFSGPMVRALLEDRKTQTRRMPSSPLRLARPGDRLWVRETFRHWRGSASHKTAVYSADDTWLDHGSGETFVDKVTWLTPATSPIHMPRWASRLILKVEDVRTEPLQSISEADARAEGVERGEHGGWKDYEGIYSHGLTARESYMTLWSSLHGVNSMLANPDVLVLIFTVERGNIDA